MWRYAHASVALLAVVGASGGEVVAPTVTSVEGPSWLDHLGVSIDQSRMGQMGGEAPAPATGRREPIPQLGEPEAQGFLRRTVGRIFDFFRQGRGEEAKAGPMNEPFTVAGADLYRLNCRSCHGPDGRGAPPEIKSLVGPVRGTSLSLLQDRMKKLGRSLSQDMLSQLTTQAEDAIRQRLQEGGERMPRFRHLEGAEVDSLLMYLKQLAGVPKSDWHPIAVTESVDRVGEHLVKGTCHICHGATGPGGGHMMMMRGVIPSLASFPAQVPPWMVVGKVRQGMGSMGGMRQMMGFRPRMPAFPYVTEPEVAAAYLYLEAHPPQR